MTFVVFPLTSHICYHVLLIVLDLVGANEQPRYNECGDNGYANLLTQPYMGYHLRKFCFIKQVLGTYDRVILIPLQSLKK